MFVREAGLLLAYAYPMDEVARVVRDPLIGSVLHERYRLLRRIGRGGMGIVYLAEHVLIGRKYAVKVLSERANATDEMVARFHREAMAAAAVGSDHVVEVTDMGQLEDGSFFLVMEYLDGMELAKLVLKHGAFDAARAVRIVCQLCDALSAVHAQGIVHRDLKPENLFLIERRGAKDFLKVLDFGVCKLLEGPAQAETDLPALTRTNASLGTPQYMAPEQFHASARVDHRADIHAAAAVLYFMLPGKPPFDAPTLAQLAMRACVEPPPTLLAQRPELPSALDAVIQRAMAKHPEDRYPDSAALKQALLPFVELRVAANTAPTTLPGPGGSTYPTQPAHTPFQAAAPLPVRAPAVAPAPARDSGGPVVLPQRRWPLFAMAAGLVFGVLSLMIWGALSGGAHDVPRAPSAAPSVAARPAVVTPSLTLPSAVLREEPEPPPASPSPVEPPRPPLTPKVGGKRPLASSKPAEETPPVAVQPAASAPTADAQKAPTPAPAAPAAEGDATYHFPKRALKDVF